MIELHDADLPAAAPVASGAQGNHGQLGWDSIGAGGALHRYYSTASWRQPRLAPTSATQFRRPRD
jgi:hypothetical protein